MASRPSSPSQFRTDVQGLYPFPSYNTQLHASQHPTFFSTESAPQVMGRPHNSLDILLASSDVFLKGTGVDVEPCTLHGHLVLTLVEATPFKEITMQFRGKSRVPNMQSEGSTVLGGSYQTNVIFTHDWSFLEGDRKHTPTLKAGRHVFPFQLQLEGCLPSSLAIHGGLGGIGYKLRATAVRPVFATNLHAAASVRVIRSFAPEALEYQQTLEVENTWPEKMMYSLMVPHKAWAAGDTVTTLVKFSPLLKGVRIRSITSTVQEHIKTYAKIGPPHEENRTITTAKHEIRNGQAVTLQLTDPYKGTGGSRRPTPPWSTPNSPSPLSSDGVHTPGLEGVSSTDPFSAGARQLLHGVPIMGITPAESGEGSASSMTSTDRTSSTDEGIDLGDEEIVTTLPLTLPIASVPSHAMEPISVTHRIRWSILMTNPDGHTSELRCSLPLHILDHALLDEARIATSATRRLLFGLEGSQPSRMEEMELPSYPSHVLDRVANAYLPATVRVSDPPANGQADSRSSRSRGPSLSMTAGFTSPPIHITPRDTPPVTPGGVASPPALDWVNSELYRLNRAWQRPGNTVATPPDSTQTSRHPSRASSRSGSPEPGSGSASSSARSDAPARNHHHSIFSLKPFTKVASSLHHKDSHAHGKHPAPDGPPYPHHHHASNSTQPSPTHEHLPSPLFPRGTAEDEARGQELVNRAFNEVPHYDVASRGFLGGGVTPLSSMRGLPSYEEAERSQSDGDLAAGFAAARTRSVPRDSVRYAVAPASH